MDELANPFRPGAGTRPPALLGRDELIDRFGVTVRRAMAGRPGQSLMPVGLRGVGKTVLLNRFAEIAEQEGMRVGFMESPGPAGFRGLLVHQLRKVLLGLDASRPSAKVLRALRVLKTFSLQTADGSRFTIDVEGLAGEADSGDLGEDVTDLFLAVGEAGRERGRGVLLAVDELQCLDEPELSALITAVHRTTQRDLPLVLVGAGLPALPSLAGEAKSYAERLFEFPLIGSLEPDDAAAAIAVPCRAGGVDITPEAVTAIVGHSGAYPYFLQEWGYHVWNATEVPPIERADVERATPRVLAHLDANFFRVRVERLTPSERAYLQAMAALGPGPHRSADIAAELGVRVGSVAPRRNVLISKGLLLSPSRGETAFTVPLFDEFLRRAAP